MTQSTATFTDFSDLDDGLVGSTAKGGVNLDRVHIVNGGQTTQALVDCPKCRGTGRWVGGWQGQVVRTCFRCDGKGKITVRSMAATKAKATAAANMQTAFQAFMSDPDNLDLIQFLSDNADWSEFFRSMRDQLQGGKALSERQVEAVRSAMAKIAASRAAKAAAKQASAKAVDISAIQALMGKAETKLKNPIFRAGDLEITKDRVVGTKVLWVRELDKGAWLGKVEGGKWNPFKAAKPDTLATLECVAADPSKAAMAFAFKHRRCSCCGITLRKDVSIVAAIGPVCAENWGLEHLRDEAARAIANGEV